MIQNPVKSSFRTLLTNRNFVLLWCAYGISAMGDHISEYAILATQHALDADVDVTPLLARMTFVFMLPFFLLGTLTGAVADRLPRRWIMIAADVIRVGIMLTFLTWITRCTAAFGSEWGPFVPLGLVGVFAAFFSPARSAMVPALVRQEELIPANAMIGGLGMIAVMFAALFSGELAGRGLIREAFAIDAATFAASAVCVLLISRRWGPINEHRSEKPLPLLRSVRDGALYIGTHHRVAQLIGVAVVFWLSGAAVRSVIPAVVKNVYGGGFPEMARFQVWIGLGLAVGAVIITIVGRALRSEWAISWFLVGAGLGIWGMVLSVFAGFAPSTAHVIGAISIFGAGICGAGLQASYMALLQRIVPDAFRGRVFGVLDVATNAGLLAVTGVLAIPRWEHLDRWVGVILMVVATLLVAVGLLSYFVRTRDLPFDRTFALVRSLNEFMVRFWYRCRCDTRCTIPRSGPVIVTANHVCPIDPLLVYATCNYRRLSFMIAAEYDNIPVAKYFIHLARCIPVRRGQNDIKATKTALRRLRDGEALGIFIQGGIRGREHDDQLKNGVSMLALRSGATVIPAHISGAEERGGVIRSLFSRYRVRIAYGPPVDLSEFADRRGPEALDAATQKIFEAINALAPARPQ